MDDNSELTGLDFRYKFQDEHLAKLSNDSPAFFQEFATETMKEDSNVKRWSATPASNKEYATLVLCILKASKLCPSIPESRANKSLVQTLYIEANVA